MSKPMTGEEYREALRKAFEESYVKYSEDWARTFEQGPFRPPWYVRLWRQLKFWARPKLSGLGAPK